MAHDLVIRGGVVATATDSKVVDLGIRGGRIVAIDEGLPQAGREIDARGLLVVPGGVDVHKPKARQNDLPFGARIAHLGRALVKGERCNWRASAAITGSVRGDLPVFF